MAKQDIWSTIHTERRALATDLETVGGAQWDTPSLCTDWTVQDVLAHMTATAKITPPAFFGKMAASGFSLAKMQNKDIAVERGSSPDDTLARFRTIIDSTRHPPGPTETWLGETIVHGEDIRRPLGIEHEYPAGAAAQVAEAYGRTNLVIGSKRRVDGVRLQATDTDWSHGDGPPVSGPIVSLLLVMAGRKAALDDLTGEGVATLSSRG
jgi:uncharacterized protein (TIGR03083 family)